MPAKKSEGETDFSLSGSARDNKGGCRNKEAFFYFLCIFNFALEIS